jgi:hypothetical protein
VSPLSGAGGAGGAGEAGGLGEAGGAGAHPRDGLVELALGLSAGPDRDHVLAHVRSCAACQDELTALSGTATSLWEAARPVEPPAGFEQRVLASLDAGATHHRPRGRLLALAAALVALVALAAGVTVGWRLATGRDDRFVSEYEETLRQLGGRALAGARLVDPGGAAVGRIFVYEGESSWLYVELDEPPEDDWAIFLGDDRIGRPRAGGWGMSIDGIEADDITAVEVRDAAGGVVARTAET